MAGGYYSYFARISCSCERVVKAVRLDNVVVELCGSRQEFIFGAGIMYTSNNVDNGQQSRSNMLSFSGTGFFGAAGVQTALALRLLLALFSSKISSDVNRPFGDEVVNPKFT
ncbi:hypothetical protein REPUB_Repub07fG0126800 [Reevesia pubescens]